MYVRAIIGNGFVDYDEFIQMMTNTPLKPLSAEEELLQKTFQIFDIDGNGYICADEIKQTMANLGEVLTDAEVSVMITAADKNGKLTEQLTNSGCHGYSIFVVVVYPALGDGKIDMNEFSGLIHGVNGPFQMRK